MTYTIVFKSGEVKRHIMIDKVVVSGDCITFSANNFRSYTYPTTIIASVVFYP
jgi:hypothetical protein